MFTYGGSTEAFAFYQTTELGGPGLSSGAYAVTVDAERVNINVAHDSNEVLMTAMQGESFTIMEDMGDGWLKVSVKGTVGYLPQSGNASITEKAEIEASDAEEVLKAEPLPVVASKRESLVNYALQFVGGRYVYGGNDPHSGVDCSGFTRYVMQHGAGISLNRSSGAQATQGVAVSAAQMRPGDLVFYGNGSRINHVAMYIGNGQIVHASTYKTGIKVSNWGYRPAVKIVNVLGD
ncbi:MAG: C40 family peptidase [Hungatella sp.]